MRHFLRFLRSLVILHLPLAAMLKHALPFNIALLAAAPFGVLIGYKMLAI